MEDTVEKVDGKDETKRCCKKAGTSAGLRTSINLRHKNAGNDVKRQTVNFQKQDVKHLVNEASELVRNALRQGNMTDTKPKFSTSVQRSTAQRDSPYRGRSASCLFEFWKQLRFCKPRRKNLDEKIGQSVEQKPLHTRALEEFKRIDQNGDGLLYVDEVKLCFDGLNVRVPEADILRWIETYDEDKNGTLDFNEFLRMFRSIQSLPDLRQEFLIAKVLGSGENSIRALSNGEVGMEDILLRPIDLQQFIIWSTGGKESPLLYECAFRMHCMISQNGNASTDPRQPWTVPASERRLEVEEDLTDLDEDGSSEPNDSASSPNDLLGAENLNDQDGRPNAAFSDDTRQNSSQSTSSAPVPTKLIPLQVDSDFAIHHSTTTSPRKLNIFGDRWKSSEGPYRKSGLFRRLRESRRSRGKSLEHSEPFSSRSRISMQESRLPKWHPDSDDYEEPRIQYDLFVQMMTDFMSNSAGDPVKLNDVYQDMSKPLSHYFISSSHNSYLIGNQLSSESTAYAIIRALKLGVRVIELDAWDGPSDEPIVTHGNTLCKPMDFFSCIEALRDYGFVASEYPVIITIENHCSMTQQHRQVQILESILGDRLHRFPVPDQSNLKAGVQSWLSPQELKFKFVIRDRPDKRMTRHDRANLKHAKAWPSGGNSLVASNGDLTDDDSVLRSILAAPVDLANAVSASAVALGNKFHSGKRKSQAGKLAEGASMPPEISEGSVNVDIVGKTESGGTQRNNGPEMITSPGKAEEEEKFLEGDVQINEELLDMEMEDEDDEVEHFSLEQYDPSKDGVIPALLKLMYIKNVSIPVNKVGSEIVQYESPAFATSSSLSEQKMRRLALPGPRAAALNTYAKKHLIRVFPAGARISSSNYDPVPAWNAGCQIVALNYQSFGSEVWLNQGKFSDNGGCGYVLKPDDMLNATSTGVIMAVPKHSENTSARLEMSNGGQNSEEHLVDESTKGHKGGNKNKAIRLFGHQSIRFGDLGKRSLPWSLEEGGASFLDQPVFLEVELISGHYLPKQDSHAQLSPYVEITLRGLEQDDKTCRSMWVENNGFDPTWRETFAFPIHNIELGLVCFTVRSVDDGRGKSKGQFIAQNVLPLSCIRPGYRCVPLRYANCALIEQCFLFCKFTLSSSPPSISTDANM